MYKNSRIENWKKVLFLDETHCFEQRWHSKYVRISEGEKLSLMHFHQTVKQPQKNVLQDLPPCHNQASEESFQ